MEATLQKLWPLRKDHYLCTDDNKPTPYTSCCLLIWQWAFNHGFIEDDVQTVFELPSRERSRDWQVICSIVPEDRWVSPNAIAEQAEHDLACVTHGLITGLDRDALERMRMPVLINGKPRKRWYYRRIVPAKHIFGCLAKKKHYAWESANAEALRMNKTHSTFLQVYLCDHCNLWHTGHVTKRAA